MLNIKAREVFLDYLLQGGGKALSRRVVFCIFLVGLGENSLAGVVSHIYEEEGGGKTLSLG